jgi:peptide subunit release factor 1 (eRF1)
MSTYQRAVRQLEKALSGLNEQQQHEYFASGRVFVGHVDLAEERPDGTRFIKRWFVAKIRGVIVGNPGEWKHETYQGALDYGHDILKQWKDELRKS